MNLHRAQVALQDGTNQSSLRTRVFREWIQARAGFKPTRCHSLPKTGTKTQSFAGCCVLSSESEHRFPLSSISAALIT